MLPNLIVIGASKAATTSLHYYLGLHPQISMAYEKELNFFVQERNWGRGIEWYQAQFGGNADIRGEASPLYTFHPFFGGVPGRMHATVPEARLIYLVRDPIERMISHYVHVYADGADRRLVDEAFSRPTVHPHLAYREAGRYYLQLEQYWRRYAAAQILVVTQEELFRARHQTMQKVFRFLGVDESFSSPWFRVRRHRSAAKRRGNWVGCSLERATRKVFPRRGDGALQHWMQRLLLLPFSTPVRRPSLSEGLRAELIDYFRDDVTCLRAATGLALDGWCV